jgi:hypothetical protein
MTSRYIDALAIDPTIEIERFARLDHPTRRCIAYVLADVPEAVAQMGDNVGIAGNPPAPFVVSADEAAERADAYSALAAVRACTAIGAEGQRQRRQHFGDLLAMAKVDVRWKRLNDLPAFIFCYERLAGPAWRQLLASCWTEARFQRRQRGTAQLPLDRRLVDDAAVPRSLEEDPAPTHYPTMADADAMANPLLAGL